MNTLRKITLNRWYGANILAYGLLGLGIGLNEGIKYQESDDTKFSKTCRITSSSLMMGSAGIIFGIASPLILPIAIPVYAYLTYQENKN
jgi:hypothetical protein